MPRLGVTGTNISEGYHGVAQGGPSNWGKRNPTPTTQFPQAYGLAATWDPTLLQRVAANQALRLEGELGEALAAIGPTLEAYIASAEPVLPPVYSTTRPPAFNSPRRSAPSITIRSLGS